MHSINDLKAAIENLDAEGQRRLCEWLEKEERQKNDFRDCFVIMPFSKTRDYRDEKYWDHFFLNFLKPALAECRYRARRSEATEDNFVRTIMDDLACTDVVLAVLTDDKPNVWYELGVRHSQRPGTIMIRQEGHALPSALPHPSTAFYPESLDVATFGPKLRKHLKSASREAKDSPVASFLSAGLVYCINLAIAAKREALEKITMALKQRRSTESILADLKKLDATWAEKRQLTIVDVKLEKVILHRNFPNPNDPTTGWIDVISGNQSLYPAMKIDGAGLRLASIERIHGRVTAVAYESHPETGWLVVAEAHVQRGQL